MNLEGTLKKLIENINQNIKKADIKSDDKEFVENTIRMDHLTGACELALILNHTELAKEINIEINQILEKTF